MKAGLSNFTVSLAQTLAPDKILVNSISPGPVWSKSWENEAREQSNGSSLEQTKKEIMFTPARVLMQDLTGVPAVVDLAAMREAIESLGGDPSKINPLSLTDLVTVSYTHLTLPTTPYV